MDLRIFRVPYGNVGAVEVDGVKLREPVTKAAGVEITLNN